MPVAGGSIAEPKHYHYEDVDTVYVNEAPPVQNTWYPGIDDEDVRHIWAVILQMNDEAAGKNCEVRWTIDGKVYLLALNLANNAQRFLYRNQVPSTGGTLGIGLDEIRVNAGYYVDKRSQAYKTEIRITDAPGTNQTLKMWDVYETETET